MSATDKAMVTVETGFLAGPSSRRLLWREWSGTASRPAWGVLLVHGAGEHSGRYGALGHYFASRGVPVMSLDLRGFGESEGPPGHVICFREYQEDVLAVRDLARRRRAGMPLVLVGHSMGGLIALSLALEEGSGFEAVVASAPCLELTMRVPAWKAAVGKLMAGVIPRLSMTNEIDPADLARNPEVGRAYAADPKVCRIVSAGWFTALLRCMAETSARAGEIRIPVFILQATEDRLVSAEGSRRFFERLGEIRKRFELMHGYYHELFQEDDREVVFDLIRDWVEDGVLIGQKATPAV